jgi:hypothetical protein
MMTCSWYVNTDVLEKPGASMFHQNVRNYEGKSISKLQMNVELKYIRVLMWVLLLFLNIIARYMVARVPSGH